MPRNSRFAPLFVLLALCGLGRAAETLAERRARVEQMDAEQKEQLLQNYQRFTRLDEAERERLRRLHGDLEAADDQDELRNLMQRYTEWLNDLPPNQRAEINSAKPEERLKKIESLRAAQKKQESFRLDSSDVEAMRNWIHAHQLEIKWRTWRDGGDKPLISPEQLAELRTSLSADGREKLDDAIADDVKANAAGKKNHEAVRRLLLTWAMQTSRRGSMGRPGGGPGGPGGPGVATGPGGPGGQHPGFRRPTEQELQDFLKNDLREQERADLLNLPHDEMQVVLRRLWATREFRRNHEERQRAGGAGPGGFGPGSSSGFGTGAPGHPGDERRQRGPGDKRGDRPPRRGPEAPPAEKASDIKPLDEKPTDKSPDAEKSADEKPAEAPPS